jgi:hypothetical protein
VVPIASPCTCRWTETADPGGAKLTLLDQREGPVARSRGDGSYDQDNVCRAMIY